MFQFYLRFYSNREQSEAVARRCSVEKVFLEIFLEVFLETFTGKHLCQSLFFNKVAGLGPATLLKKGLWHRCFPVNFEKFLRTPFSTEHPWWLLLRSINHITTKTVINLIAPFTSNKFVGYFWKINFFQSHLDTYASPSKKLGDYYAWKILFLFSISFLPRNSEKI